MTDQEIQSLHLLIEGQVQGVGYRYFVVECARDRNIRGWVRNLADGRVEIMAEGSKRDLALFLSKVEKGPSYSKIASIHRDWEKGAGKFEGFKVLATALRQR